MPLPQYQVRATVVDLTRDTPQPSDRFLVDSNAWLWFAYTNIAHVESRPSPSQLADYPGYIGKAMSCEAHLCVSVLSFAEVANRIEATERQIFTQGRVEDVRTKDFRHNYPEQRNNALAEIEAAWRTIMSVSEPVAAEIDVASGESFVRDLRTHAVDAYDLFILGSMRQNAITQIITDDGDFATVASLTVFTANERVIRCARQQGKLRCRST